MVQLPAYIALLLLDLLKSFPQCQRIVCWPALSTYQYESGLSFAADRVAFVFVVWLHRFALVVIVRVELATVIV